MRDYYSEWLSKAINKITIFMIGVVVIGIVILTIVH
jgi:hypothetical protein